MNTTDRGERLVQDYLRRLEEAASSLSAERRAELVLEIRDHIDEARTASRTETDDLWMRNLLERLGSPAEIAAAALADGDTAGARRPRRDGFGLLEKTVVWLLGIGLIAEIIGALNAGTEPESPVLRGEPDFDGIGRLLIIFGVVAALFSSRWSRAAKWTLGLVSAAFLVIWAILENFPPVPSVDESGRSYDDPTRWHWQGGFFAVAAIFVAMLASLVAEGRRSREPGIGVREVTVLALVGLGWYVGPLAAVVALVVAWRSPRLRRLGRLGAMLLLVPILVAGLTIPLGLVQPVNRDGLVGEGTAWALLLGCSVALAAWFVVRFRRSPVEELV